MTQKLITSEIIKAAAKFPLYSQESNGKDALVLARFFTPARSFSWYMIEYDLKTGEAFGLVVNFDCVEYGYFNPEEMQNENMAVNLLGVTSEIQAVERDIYVKPGKETLEEVMKRYGEMTPAFWEKEEAI